MDKNNRSFTLVEILVVSAITILLSGFSLAMFSSYKDDRLLTTQASRFSQMVELARDKATAGDTGLCSDSATAYVNGYTVQVNPTEMQLIPNCDTEPTPIKYAIEKNIVFVTPSFTLQFDSQKYAGSAVAVPIKNTSTNKCKLVTIDESGLVTSANSPCP